MSGETWRADDLVMRALRTNGQFICQCTDPKPERVAWFGGYQCANCLKLYDTHRPTLEEPWTPPNASSVKRKKNWRSLMHGSPRPAPTSSDSTRTSPI